MSKFNKTAKKGAVEDEPNPFAVDGDPDIIAVFDGDQIAFRTAAAAEERGIKVTNTTLPDDQGVGIWKNRTQFKKFMNGIDYEDEMFTVEDTQIAEPIQNAIATMKATIANICKQCNAGSYEIYVGDSNNFRDELPLPTKYKDRDTSVRPLLLKELKQYLRDFKGAIWADGIETDDYIAIRMYEGYKQGKKVIGISSDKDQMQTQGWILDPNKMEKPYLIKGFGGLFIDSSTKSDTVKGWGRKFLYYQILHEDKADTYSARDVYKQLHGKKPRFGEKAAYGLLNPCKTDKECFEVLAEQYKKWYGEDEFTYTDWKGNEVTTDWFGLMSTYFLTAYMRRSEDDQTTLTTYLEEFGAL